MIDENSVSGKAIFLALITPIFFWWAYVIYCWITYPSEELGLFRNSDFTEYFLGMNIMGGIGLIVTFPRCLLAFPFIAFLYLIYKILLIKLRGIRHRLR